MHLFIHPSVHSSNHAYIHRHMHTHTHTHTHVHYLCFCTCWRTCIFSIATSQYSVSYHASKNDTAFRKSTPEVYLKKQGRPCFPMQVPTRTSKNKSIRDLTWVDRLSDDRGFGTQCTKDPISGEGCMAWYSGCRGGGFGRFGSRLRAVGLSGLASLGFRI